MANKADDVAYIVVHKYLSRPYQIGQYHRVGLAPRDNLAHARQQEDLTACVVGVLVLLCYCCCWFRCCGVIFVFCRWSLFCQLISLLPHRN